MIQVQIINIKNAAIINEALNHSMSSNVITGLATDLVSILHQTSLLTPYGDLSSFWHNKTMHNDNSINTNVSLIQEIICKFIWLSKIYIIL